MLCIGASIQLKDMRKAELPKVVGQRTAASAAVRRSGGPYFSGDVADIEALIYESKKFLSDAKEH
jgi:hypothetical protein